MRRLAVGWVWTNDPSAPVVTATKMLPLLGVGSWILWMLLRLPVFAVSGILLSTVQRIVRGTFRL